MFKVGRNNRLKGFGRLLVFTDRLEKICVGAQMSKSGSSPSAALKYP